jgi:hypothetical protein
VTITEFLEARIAEDEAAARRCEKAFPGSWDVEDRGYHAHVVCDGPYFHHVSELDQQHTNVDHLGGALQMIADFNPARVLAECAAKRAIIGGHEGRRDLYGGRDAYLCEMCTEAGPNAQGWPCATLKALAAVYSDHPDYDKDWAL